MKKLILITGIIIYVLFALSVFASASAEDRLKDHYNSSAITTEPNSDYVSPKYILKSIKGKLVVLDSNGDILEQTDTLVSILPKSDRIKLEAGISVFDDRELRQLLEDFCS